MENESSIKVFNYSYYCSVLVLSILVLSGVILLPVLLPLSATDNAVKTQGAKSQTTSKGTFNELDKLSMANITVRSVCFFLQKYYSKSSFDSRVKQPMSFFNSYE